MKTAVGIGKVFGIAAGLIALGALEAQPVWVVQALNNVRRAAQVASKAKHGAKIALVLGKCHRALPEAEIEKLARIAAKKNGLKEVGEILGKMNFVTKYGDEAGHLILQDTYLRIAVRNGHLSHGMASSTLKHLGGTPGLTTLLRKINSVNPSQVKGHLRELEIALSTKKRGFETISLGQKFADGLKGGDTDLDVFVRRGKINFAIESKAYSGPVPGEMARADAKSLAVFCKDVKNTMPVFCFENEPNLHTKAFLKSNNIRCLWGTPEEIAAKLDVLSSIH